MTHASVPPERRAIITDGMVRRSTSRHRGSEEDLNHALAAVSVELIRDLFATLYNAGLIRWGGLTG
jgi:hypothetical protein